MTDERVGIEGQALVLEASAELAGLALRPAGDAQAEEAMEDDGGGEELLDVELFRDIELLLDSGRQEIQEAYLAAIDSLVGADGGVPAVECMDHWNAPVDVDMELELSLSHQHQPHGDDALHLEGSDLVGDEVYQVDAAVFFCLDDSQQKR